MKPTPAHTNLAKRKTKFLRAYYEYIGNFFGLEKNYSGERKLTKSIEMV